MKKLTAVIAALALFFSASAFGPTPENDLDAVFNLSNAKSVNVVKLNKAISTAFAKKFASATQINWKEKEGLYFGYFNQGEKPLVVAYTEEGEFVAIARQVKINELPLAVTETLKEKYQDCFIPAEVTEIVMQGETAYYLNVENKASIRLLKVLPEGSVEVTKRTKKKVLVGTVM